MMKRQPEPMTLRNFRFTESDDRALAVVRDAHPEIANDTALLRFLIHKEASYVKDNAARERLQKGGKR